MLGVPPLIELKNHVLISSVSPLIRKKYFKKEAICKTLEMPCLNENQSLNENQANSYLDNIPEYNKKLATETYLNIVKLIAKSKSRKEFEKEMIIIYPNQVEIAKNYAKEIFGEDYPPF